MLHIIGRSIRFQKIGVRHSRQCRSAEPRVSSRPSCSVTPKDSELLAGTMPSYQRHLFLPVSIPPSSWPTEIAECGSFVEKVCQAVQADTQKRAKVSLVYRDPKESWKNFELPDNSIVLQPSGLLLVGVKDTPEALASIVDGTWRSQIGIVETVVHPGWRAVVAVCAHTRRDARCAKCGPPVIEALQEYAPADVAVWAVSHVGGHKYAANVGVFPPGDWYGQLPPEQAYKLLPDRYGLMSPASELRHLWRGRLSSPDVVPY